MRRFRCNKRYENEFGDRVDEMTESATGAYVLAADAEKRIAELEAELQATRPVLDAAGEIAFQVRDGGPWRAAFMLQSFADIVGAYEKGGAK